MRSRFGRERPHSDEVRLAEVSPTVWPSIVGHAKGLPVDIIDGMHTLRCSLR